MIKPTCGEICPVASDLHLPHIAVPEAYALDMDRTVASVTAGMLRLVEVVADYGVDHAAILTAQRQVEADGGAFSPLGFIRQALDESRFASFGQEFLARSEPLTAYPDTLALLDSLDEAEAPWVVPTYGVDPLWQGMKAAAFDPRPKYVEILPNSKKGPHIERWRGPDGTFDFIGTDETGAPTAIYHAEAVVLVDDKLASHYNLPTDCRGMLLQRPEEARLKSQGGIVPEELAGRLTVIENLGQLSVVSAPQSPALRLAAPQTVAFRPAYASQPEGFPGLIVSGSLPFGEMQQIIDEQFAAA
jgi:hypothetical protein